MTYRPGRPWSRLPEVVREKVLERWRERDVDSEWASSVVDDFLRITICLGYHNVEPHWGLGGVQGDGACFTGLWSPPVCSPNELKKEFRGNDELTGIADRFIVLLVEAKVRGFELPAFQLNHQGRYYHENSIDFDFETFEHLDPEQQHTVAQSLKDLSRDLMRWFFRNLQLEYEHQTSDDYLVESIEANDYHFNFAGDIL